MPYRKVHRLLADRGFAIVRQRGSHVFYRHPDGRTTIVPRHPGQDIPPGLVRKILADARIEATDVE